MADRPMTTREVAEYLRYRTLGAVRKAKKAGRLVPLGRLGGNPAEAITPFDTSQHATYSYEEPNSLTVEELRDLLACMRSGSATTSPNAACTGRSTS